MSPGEVQALRMGLLFVAPWLVGFLIFTLYPVLATFYLSFTDYKVLSPPRWVGLENYRTLLADTETFWPSLFNTAFLFLELPLALTLSLALALLLDQKLRGMAIYRTIFYLPSVVPVVASAMALDFEPAVRPDKRGPACFAHSRPGMARVTYVGKACANTHGLVDAWRGHGDLPCRAARGSCPAL